MSYFYYDNYKIKETEKAFLVSEISGYDSDTVRIKKSIVEELDLDEEPEMVAILLAKIELIKIDFTMFDKRAPKSIIKDKRFKEKLEMLLNVKLVEEIIEEISEMKYHEIKEFFVSEPKERIDY